MRYTTFLFTLFVFSVCYGQDLVVTYKATYMDLDDKQILKMKKDLALSDSQMQGFIASYHRIRDDVSTQEIVLTTKGSKGYKLELPVIMQSDFGYSSNSASSALDLFDYMYSFDNKHLIGYSNRESNAIKFDSKQVKWNIKSDSKEILGYKCYKAEVEFNDGRENGTFRSCKYVWFAPSLNKSGGPIVYPGVPGLILEVQNEQSSIKAISLNTVKNTEIKETEKQIISETDYINILIQTSEAIESRIKN